MNDDTNQPNDGAGITKSGIVLPANAEAAVRRGKEAAYRLQQMVLEYRNSGHLVIEVRVSKDVADDMRANFVSICDSFDNVLPSTVHGVPFYEGGTGGRDYVMKVKKVDQEGTELGPVRDVEIDR